MSMPPLGGFNPQQQQGGQQQPMQSQPMGIAGGGTGMPPRPMTQPPMGGFGQPLPSGQPMQGGYQKQTFPPMGGFGRPLAGEPMGGQQPLPQVFQDFMNQQKQGGQPFGIADGGPSMDPQSLQYAQAMQRFNAMQGQQVGNTGQMVGPMGGQFGGQPMQGGFGQPQQQQIQQLAQQLGVQPMQGGFNPQPGQGTLQRIQPSQQQLQQNQQMIQQQMQHYMPIEQQFALGQSGLQPMSPLRQDPNADDPQRQPRMQNMQNMQQQGGPQGQPMPQAPTTQQMGQENPRMQAMRSMQRMRFGR